MTSCSPIDSLIPVMERCLLENTGIDKEDEYEATSLLQWAIRKKMWDRGDEVNLKTKNGSAKLQLAFENDNDIEIVRHLLRRGVNINDQDDAGRTALHVAVMNNCIYPNDISEVVALLLESGANVNCVDRKGQTPLHIATMFGNSQVSEFLFMSGADVSSTDSDGRTPLHLAAKQDDAVTVEILLQAGADVQAVDTFGCTPLELTFDPIVAEYLLLKGAVLREATIHKYLEDEDLMEVLIKLSAVNLLKLMASYDKTIEMACNRSPELNEFKHDCIVEVEKMKKHNIGTLSLFHVLIDSPDQFLASRADEIKKELDIAERQYEYPIYMSLMRSKFMEGVKRKPLLDEATDSLPILIPELRKLILTQLTDRDLKNVSKAFESTNTSC